MKTFLVIYYTRLVLYQEGQLPDEKCPYTDLDFKLKSFIRFQSREEHKALASSTKTLVYLTRKQKTKCFSAPKQSLDIVIKY